MTEGHSDGRRKAVLGLHESAEAITAAFDDVYDQGVQFHGFTDYMRDYDVVVEAGADPRTGMSTQYLLYRFRHCVHAEVTTRVGWDVWRRSLDDRLTDYRTGVDLDGYVWGVQWQEIYPGMQLVQESEAAAEWTDRIGIPMYEAHLELNAHDVRLVFSGLEVHALESGWTPYTAGDATVD